MPLILIPPYGKKLGLLYGSIVQSPDIKGWQQDANQYQSYKSTYATITLRSTVDKVTKKLTARGSISNPSGYSDGARFILFRNGVQLAYKDCSVNSFVELLTDAIAGNYEIRSDYLPSHLTFTLADDGSITNMQCYRDAYRYTSTYPNWIDEPRADYTASTTVSVS